MLMNQSFKIVVISSVWPEPASSAAGGRMLGLLRLFKERFSEVFFLSPAADSEFSVDLNAMGITKQKIELNHSSFDVLIASIQPQIVLFDRFMVEEQFGWRVAEQCPRALRVLDTVDLHFLRHARHSAVKAETNLSDEDLKSDLAKREIASILRSDLSLIISEFEMNLLIQNFKIDPMLLEYFPLLVPPIDEATIHNWPTFAERKDFVFIGNFLHEPNWDAVLYLKKTIWPLIYEKLPQANLFVYGAYPTHKNLQLHHSQSGFHVIGRASNAMRIVSNARICLAPLRFGAGVKGKLLEAMICGTPSITTKMGAEGLQGKLPWNGMIAETVAEIASAAVALYQNSEAWYAAQKHGIEIINTRNSGDPIETQLIKRIESVLENLALHRSQNFIGALLQHHTLKSTKYMSKWIEEKNKKSA